MRLKINFSKNTEKVPNNLQHFNSYIHKCLGKDNPYHDTHSDYSCTGIMGGVITDGGRSLDFPNGGYIVFSTSVDKILNVFMSNLMANTNYGFGMNIIGTDFLAEDYYTGDNLVMILGKGYLLRKTDENGKTLCLTPNNTDNFAEKMEEQIINKFTKINPKLNFKGFKIEFKKYKVNNIYVKNVRNVTTTFVIKIKTNKKVMDYLYHYGIGHSTGSGFGNICYYDNYQKLYPITEISSKLIKKETKKGELTY